MPPRPKNQEPTGQAWVSQVSSYTIAEVKNAIYEHECGTFRDSGLMFDLMDRNPRVNAALDTRCKGVVGLPFHVEPADPSPQAKQYADEIQECWWDIFPESLLSGLLRNVVGMGFGPSEATFSSVEKRWVPTLHPWHCSNWYHNTYTNAWQVYDIKGRVRTVVPGAGQWVLLESSTYRPWMRGVVRCLGLDDAARGFAATDWMRWSEKHGIPITAAQVPSDQATSNAGKQFATDLRTMGREGVVKIPTVDKDSPQWGISYVEPKTISWQGFRALIEHCDKDVAIGILGQTLTTEVSGGSLAAAQVHELVRQDYIRADVEVAATTLRKQVLAYYMLYNHGPDSVTLTPWPKWDTSRPGEQLERAKMLEAVSSSIKNLVDASSEVDVAALLDSFGITRKKTKPQ